MEFFRVQSILRKLLFVRPIDQVLGQGAVAVNEKLCCVPQKISGHRKQVPQAEREINLLTSRKLYELTKHIITFVSGN